MTTGVACPAPILQFFGNDGKPAVGGSVLTQVGGFNAATYQDINLTTPLPNPIPLNSRGEVSNASGASCQLFLTPNTVYVFTLSDAGGNQFGQATYVNGIQINQATIGQLLYPRTPAEISAAVTPSNFAFTAGRPIIEVERYGAVLDGVTDDSQALKTALSVASQVGGIVHIPASANGLAVASANLPITVQSNTGIVGDGMEDSKIVVTGVAIGGLFQGTNVKGFYFAGISCTGNSQGNTGAQSFVFNFQSDNSATKTTGDICIERSRFTNFAAFYWMWFRNQATGGFNMDNIWVRGCVFITQNGNCIGPTSVGPSSYCLAVEGLNNWSGSGGLGLVRNVWVEDNYAECSFNKGFGVAWQSTRNVHFIGNVVENTGQGSSSDDTANYAFLIYNNGGVSSSPNPDNIYLERNIITNPRDAGIYAAFHAAITNGAVFIRNNVITGQTCTVTSPRIKGAIALDGVPFPIVEGNLVDSCFWGIMLVGEAVGNAVRIRGNRVTNALTSGNSIYVQAGTSMAGSMAKVEILDNYISAPNGRAIYADVTSTAGMASLVIERNFASSAFECIEVSSRSGTALLGEVSISYNECNGAAATSGGIIATSFSLSTQRTRIANNRFTGTWGNTSLLQITSSINLSVLWNEFHDINGGSQFCFSCNAARGRLEGNRFINVANAQTVFVSGGEDLGRSTPTWTGADNDFVENLQPVEAGAAASKYVLTGWRWDNTGAAWRQQRCLTGN